MVTAGVLAGGTTAVAAGQRTITVPSHTRSAEGNRPIARVPGAFGTTIAVGRFADVSSSNWAGIAENGTTYTRVSASWTVPTVQPSIPLQVSSSWIGIDGYSNSNLIQTGTEEDTSGGATSYYAWWEILPAAETPIFSVSPGDQMSADIFKVSATTWTIDITDHTSGQNFSQNKSYSGPANSAEWIQEMTGTNPQAPLANFGTASFTSLNFTAANPAANTPTLIRMVNSSNHTIAYPTVPGASDLTVTYGQPSTTTNSVNASPSPAALGTSVTYSATVAATGGVVTPIGSVTFSTGSTSLCTATLSSGSGSCVSSAAPIGTDTGLRNLFRRDRAVPFNRVDDAHGHQGTESDVDHRGRQLWDLGVPGGVLGKCDDDRHWVANPDRVGDVHDGFHVTLHGDAVERRRLLHFYRGPGWERHDFGHVCR